MIHLIVGGMWLGTLTVIVIVGISAAFKTPDAVRPGARAAEMINVFSPLALTCGGAVVLTGVGSSVIEVPTIASLWTTPYGVVLLLKLFFVALLFAAGAWNWRRMKPRLTGDNAIDPLRSSASLELMLGVAVLAVTAILVALEVP
jgi:putative copper export protein